MLPAIGRLKSVHDAIVEPQAHLRTSDTRDIVLRCDGELARLAKRARAAAGSVGRLERGGWRERSAARASEGAIKIRDSRHESFGISRRDRWRSERIAERALAGFRFGFDERHGRARLGTESTIANTGLGDLRRRRRWLLTTGNLSERDPARDLVRRHDRGSFCGRRGAMLVTAEADTPSARGRRTTGRRRSRGRPRVTPGSPSRRDDPVALAMRGPCVCPTDRRSQARCLHP